MRIVTTGRVALVAALVVALLALGACAGAIAPAPPPQNPVTTEEGRVAGERRVVAPRAARRLQDMGFTTRRFAADSLWGWRAQEKISARLRYANAAGDSTRVLVELWGPCQPDQRACLFREARAILGALATEDAAPQ